MGTKKLDEEIDRLYQVPLDRFIAARNALAKDAGRDGAAIKHLAKPPLAAWAVNQLYWDRRPDYDALVEAAERMRKTHKAVIEGRRGDLRAAGQEHELALEAALKSTAALLKERGHPVTDAARHAILNTLRALPGEELPGRLSRALTPGGFEMLAGVVPVKGPRVLRSSGGQDPGTQGLKDLRTQREAGERAVRKAEQRARRAEFETARAVRDATKAEKRVEEARRAVEDARAEAAAAERDAAAALRAREAAERKSRDAGAALEAARARTNPNR